MKTFPLPRSASTELHAPSAVAESVLGGIDWQNNMMGFCRCPGEHFHTHQSGKRDCRVTLDGAPTLFCFHTSCLGFIEAKNRELRSAIGKAKAGASLQPYRPTAQDLERKRGRERDEQLKAKSARALKKILAQFQTDENVFRDSSPWQLDSALPEDDWRLLLQLFPNDAVVWVGAVIDSGEPQHVKNFRPVCQWLAGGPNAPGNFTCPAVFKAGSFSRANDNVSSRPFLVIESDTLSRSDMLAVVRWVQSFLSLRAVVCTGGKSLHGWFEYPSPEAERELRLILPRLQCDPALFKASQPCRLPGAWREEKSQWQSLLWLDLKGGIQ